MPANLEQFSDALAAHAAAARGAVAAIRLSETRHLTGTLWRPDVVVASEQSLPKRDEFELIVAGGSVVNAKVAGRDPGTNIAVLRLTSAVEAPTLMNGEVNAGALALAFGADGAGGVSVRLGVVNLAGPEWASSAGGRIDRHIVLDLRLARAEEGGPVLDAAGGRLGITTFGPRAKVLVIPSATIDRVVPALLKDGHIARGWLGVALQPVAVPDALHSQAGQSSGVMVRNRMASMSPGLAPLTPTGPMIECGPLPGFSTRHWASCWMVTPRWNRLRKCVHVLG